MQSVIICQGSSSAILYVEECRKRGLEPVIVNPPEVNPDRMSFDKFAGTGLRRFDMTDYSQYDEILEQVKTTNPVCVVCGSSGGVVLTDRLARDLGLKGNDPETTWRRDTKDGMHQSLKEKGLRYIRTAVVESKKDVEDFWKREKLSKAIIKFATGAGAVGNKVCNSLRDAMDYLDETMKGANIFGERERILIQEFIDGDEYVVDTVSCNGRHAVCAIWKYNKTVSADNDIVTDETRLIMDPWPGMTELVNYAFDTLDATGFEYGPCHGEYKVDSNGPVLIETNARPHGTTITSDFLDDCLTNHVSDVAIDSYTDPVHFDLFAYKLYKPKKYAAFKHLISPKECDIDLTVLKKMLNWVDSYIYTTVDLMQGTVHIPKTIDLETSPAILKLCNSDYRQLEKDCDFIYTLETEYFDLIERGNMRMESVKVKTDMDFVMSEVTTYWRTLVITGEGNYEVQYGKRTEADPKSGGYDCIFYADARESTVIGRLESVVSATTKLCESGVLLVAPEVYENLPYGVAAMELILNLVGCRVEIPHRERIVLVATRD